MNADSELGYQRGMANELTPKREALLDESHPDHRRVFLEAMRETWLDRLADKLEAAWQRLTGRR